MINYNIALCGFMGSGKSTVGPYLASMLNLRYIDSDRLIEEKSSMSIPKLFSLYGEQYFRDLEHDVIKGFCYLNPSVIALGGGTLMFDRNVELIKDHSKIFFLNASFDTICMRVSGNEDRPLANVDYKSFKQLFYSRLPKYKQISDFVVDADATPEIVSGEIIKMIGE